MRINHNLAALNTHRQLTGNTAGANKSLEKLSSGYRINRAGDDAAGLAISEKMRGQIRGLDQASRNAQDAISLIQTAEGAMSTTHNILQRMRELSVQSANDTSTDSDRQQLQKEVEQLKSEIDRVAYTTEFNTKKLLNGSLTTTKLLQGTKANTSDFNVQDIAATAAATIGGESVTTRGAIAGQTGKGYTDLMLLMRKP
jgi:flagellin